MVVGMERTAGWYTTGSRTAGCSLELLMVQRSPKESRAGSPLNGIAGLGLPRYVPDLEVPSLAPVTHCKTWIRAADRHWLSWISPAGIGAQALADPISRPGERDFWASGAGVRAHSAIVTPWRPGGCTEVGSESLCLYRSCLIASPEMFHPFSITIFYVLST